MLERAQHMTLAAVVAISLTAAGVAQDRPAAADVLHPVDVRQVKLGGELGRRVEITIEGNLLKLDPRSQVGPFVTKNTRGGEPFVGAGKTLDGMVRLAACTGNPAIIARKKQFVETLLGAARRHHALGQCGQHQPSARSALPLDLHPVAGSQRNLRCPFPESSPRPWSAA